MLLVVFSRCAPHPCTLQKRPSSSLQFGQRENIFGHSFERRAYWFVMKAARAFPILTGRVEKDCEHLSYGPKKIETFLCITAWNVSKYGVLSGPYFPAFGLNTERYFVSLRIQSECGKIRTRKNSVIWTYYTQCILEQAENISALNPQLFY